VPLVLNIEEEGRRRVVPFQGPEITIGRGPGNGVVISDPRSSRNHVRLCRTPQGLLLEDMESRNGTLLNGEAVKKSFVKPGDEFRVGNVRFVLAEGDAAVVDSPPTAAEGPEEIDLASTAASTRVGSTRSAQAPASRPNPPSAPPAEPRARSGTGSRPGNGAASTVARGVLVLEGMEGSHAGQRIAVSRSPFVIGRAHDCDLQIADKRASGKHARILLEGGAYYVEDLGSTNGTAVNKRPVQRAGLRSGALIQIGNTTFRAAVPAGASPPREAAAGPKAGVEEEFVRFDVEKFLARDRSQHPLAVVALVVILAVVGYFAVDITLRIARRPVVDPPPAENLIAANWSFEEIPPETAAATKGKVPGWKVAEGDQGAIATTGDHAQLPGFHALRLRSEGDRDLCRAVSEKDIVFTESGPYRLEGFVANESAFAAGLCVEWFRSTGDGTIPAGRSFSETARQSAEAVDVDQVLAPPREANVARVSVFVIGESGSAVFDRISLRSAEDPESPASPPGAAGAKQEETEDSPVIRAFRVGDEAPLRLAIGTDGIISLGRAGRKIIDACWAGLSPELDPLGFGPRLASVRVGTNDSSSVLFVSEVPDQKENRWVTIETTAVRTGQDVVLRWRAAPAGEGSAPPRLSLHLDTMHVPTDPAPEKHAVLPGDAGEDGEATEGLVKEISLGAREDRAAITFGSPVRLASHENPVKPGRSVLVAEATGAELEVVISAGSRHEASLARDHIRMAEGLHRAGQPGAAMEALARTKDLFPEQAGEAARAAERLAEWTKQAREALEALKGDLEVLRETQAPVVKDVLIERAGLFGTRYAGTPLAGEASSLVRDVETFWKGLDAKRTEKEIEDLSRKGQRHLEANELGLAELYFRAVLESDADGPRGREASRALNTIKGRRDTDTRIRLVQ
jgi:pSer/pThr/pTyr-binding forkhead associated (FHA) protein